MLDRGHDGAHMTLAALRAGFARTPVPKSKAKPKTERKRTKERKARSVKALAPYQVTAPPGIGAGTSLFASFTARKITAPIADNVTLLGDDGRWRSDVWHRERAYLAEKQATKETFVELTKHFGLRALMALERALKLGAELTYGGGINVKILPGRCSENDWQTLVRPDLESVGFRFVGGR